jgi:hypothetical protein
VVALGGLLNSCHAPAAAQSPRPTQSVTPSDPVTSTSDDETEEEEIAELQEEVGDRDPTYLRTRGIFSYDRKSFESSRALDRLRFKWLYAFGPKQRFAASVLMPALRMTAPSVDVSGAGDAELQVLANFYYAPRFRMGVGVVTTFQTARSPLLGGATTTVKPSWDFAAVLSGRLEVTGALYYRQSVHTVRGVPFKQLEPDITLNARLLKVTWFVESDSYYDVTPSRLAPTLKAGVSNRFGAKNRWVVAGYYAAGLNDYSHPTQYRTDIGFDLTWFPSNN